jgi:hypothetical protein
MTSLLALLTLCAVAVPTTPVTPTAPTTPTTPTAPTAPTTPTTPTTPTALPGHGPRELLEGFDAPLGKTFSGNFDDTPADEALRKLLDAAGLSVVLPHGLKAPVNAHFKDAAVEDALRAICAESGVTATRHGTVVTIQRGGPTAMMRHVIIAADPSSEDDPDAQAEAQEESAEAQRESLQAQQESEQEAQQAQQEAQQEAREAAQEAAEEEAEEADPSKKPPDRVSSGDVTLAPGERVHDLLVLRGDAKLGPGSHARDVTAMLGNVEIGPGAVVEHEVVAFRGNVHLLPGARVQDCTSVGGRVIVDPGAVIHGQSARLNLPPLPMLPPLPPLPGLPPPPVVDHPAHQHTPRLIGLGKVVLEFALYFALGLIVLAAWPRRLERVVEALRLTPARSTAVGLLGLLAIPLLALLLAVTVVGLLLWPVEAVLVVSGSVLGYAALAVLIGRKLPLKRRLTPVGQLALGTLIITLVTNLPGVGGVLAVLGWIVVLGAVLATRFGQNDPTDAPTFPLAAADAAASSAS